MGNFTPSSEREDGKPKYLYLAFKARGGKAIRRDAGGNSVEGWVDDEIIYCPASPGMEHHFEYLVGVKGYDFVETNIKDGHALVPFVKRCMARDARAQQRFAPKPKKLKEPAASKGAAGE